MNRLSNNCGIFSWFGYELPISERLRLIKKAGFFCTSVWFGYGIKLLREIIKYAEDSNIIVAIENTRKPHYLDYIYSNIESPYLGFCYDSSHDFLYSDNPGMLLNKWGHLLVATHLSDNDGTTDKHCLPKDGNIDWELVKKYFPKKTYSGNFTLEVVSKIDQRKSADLFLKDAFERILWLRSLLIAF